MKKYLSMIMIIGLIATNGLYTNAGSVICTHPSTAVGHETISSWYTEHTIVVTMNPTTTKTCRVRHWVDRVSSYCTSCYYSFGHQDQHHESHDLCGGSF